MTAHAHLPEIHNRHHESETTRTRIKWIIIAAIISGMISSVILILMYGANDYIHKPKHRPPEKASPFTGLSGGRAWHLLLHPNSHNATSMITIGDDSYYFRTTEFDAACNGTARVYCATDDVEKGLIQIQGDLENGSKSVTLDLNGRNRMRAILHSSR